MLNKALEAFGELGDDEELGPADWHAVKRYISCLNDLEGERIHPHDSPETDGTLDPMNLRDIRIRLLNGMEFVVPFNSSIFPVCNFEVLLGYYNISNLNQSICAMSLCLIN